MNSIRFFKLSAVAALVALTLAACAEMPITDPAIKDPVSKVFIDSYEKVWRAVQLSLRKYPVRTNSMESGILETDFVKGDKLFSDPNDPKNKMGLRYKITVRAVKGKIDGKSAIRITVVKNAEGQPDFFSGYQPVNTNGLEEQTVMYRIGRFLEIDKIQLKASR